MNTGQIAAVIILVISLFIISLSIIYKVSAMIFDGNEDINKEEPAISQIFVTFATVFMSLSITFFYLGGNDRTDCSHKGPGNSYFLKMPEEIR